MGKQAFEFVDFLASAGQSCWQILPLNPTGYGDSPYQSCSAYAGNHYLIDLELLVQEGLLEREVLNSFRWCATENKVDFGLQYRNKLQVLRHAFHRHGETAEFAKFRARNDSWLPDYADFMCQKDRFGGKPWYQWPDSVKTRSGGMFAGVEYEEIQFYCFTQYLFDRQWNALREYAHKKGVQIIGDVPIYVPYDSVEVWKNPELFQLNEDLTPSAVAGCPPDGFTEDGQLWGNPLYRWDVMAKDGYRWWLNRLAAAGQRYDVVRLDHFRGLESYWSIPYGDETARNGHWVKGPGMDFIRTLKRELPRLSMIAEDLGFLTDDVLDMLRQSGFPGMKVLSFAFDSEDSQYLPHNHCKNSVCYIGTHDNTPLMAWLDECSTEAASKAVDYMHLSDREGIHWGVIRTALASVSEVCILQLQDLLALGREGRMNHPGTMSDENWTWRVDSGAITPQLAQKLRQMTKLYGRLNG